MAHAMRTNTITASATDSVMMTVRMTVAWLHSHRLPTRAHAATRESARAPASAATPTTVAPHANAVARRPQHGMLSTTVLLSCMKRAASASRVAKCSGHSLPMCVNVFLNACRVASEHAQRTEAMRPSVVSVVSVHVQPRRQQCANTGAVQARLRTHVVGNVE